MIQATPIPGTNCKLYFLNDKRKEKNRRKDHNENVIWENGLQSKGKEENEDSECNF